MSSQPLTRSLAFQKTHHRITAAGASATRDGPGYSHFYRIISPTDEGVGTALDMQADISQTVALASPIDFFVR